MAPEGTEGGLGGGPLGPEAGADGGREVASGSPGSGGGMLRNAGSTPRMSYARGSGGGPGEDNGFGGAAHTAPWMGSPKGVGARAGFAVAAARKDPQGVLATQKGAGGGEQRPLATVGAEPPARGGFGSEPPLERVAMLDADEESRQGGTQAREDAKWGMVRYGPDAPPVVGKRDKEWIRCSELGAIPRPSARTRPEAGDLLPK